MHKKKLFDVVWSGFIDAVTFSAASTVAASFNSMILPDLLADHLTNLVFKGRADKLSETPLDVLERAKADLSSAMAAIAQLEATAKMAQSQAADLQRDIETLKADKSAAQAILQADQDAVTRILSRGRVRGWVEGLVVGTLSSLIAAGILWYAT